MDKNAMPIESPGGDGRLVCGDRRKQWLKLAASTVILVLLQMGCAAPVQQSITITTMSSETVEIPGIDNCDDFHTETVTVDPEQPLILLVHGCHASSARYRYLAKVFREQGQQTLCYNYDDRDTIKQSAAGLRDSIQQLSEILHSRNLTVIGHSQGGLVARRALSQGEEVHSQPLEKWNLKLVTVSSPFNGIEASDHCGIMALHILTFGATAVICQGIAGSNWHEINPRSSFVNEPWNLQKFVSNHLMIVTDERGTCRIEEADGTCVQDDYVFSIEEQINPLVKNDSRVEEMQIQAGHANVVGNEGQPPLQLIGELQKSGIMNLTPPEQQTAFLQFLYQIY